MRHLLALGAVAVLAAACGGSSEIGEGKGATTGDGGMGTGGDTGSGGSSGSGGGSTSGGSTGSSGGSVGTGGVGGECTTAKECAVPEICQVCADGSYSCATAECAAGKCTTVYPPCGGTKCQPELCPANGMAAPCCLASGECGLDHGSGCTSPTSECQKDTDCPVPPMPCMPCPDGSCAPAWTACLQGVCTSGIGACTGVECKVDRDCPPPPPFCTQCPDGSCVQPMNHCQAGTCVLDKGQCSAELSWYTTCGDPVCGLPGTGGTSSGLPACTDLQKEKNPCAESGATCDPGTGCGVSLVCTTSDPKLNGCPISRARFKHDVEYVSTAERAALADDLQSIPLVRYRYKDGVQREHLGFIIEDIEPSPSVDSPNDRVDLYGYTSMAVAALQEQHAQIEALKREVAELKAALHRRPAHR